MSQRFTLTLRQLFYQFVARALLENVFRNYDSVGLLLPHAMAA